MVFRKKPGLNGIIDSYNESSYSVSIGLIYDHNNRIEIFVKFSEDRLSDTARVISRNFNVDTLSQELEQALKKHTIKRRKRKVYNNLLKELEKGLTEEIYNKYKGLIESYFKGPYLLKLSTNGHLKP